jgi:DNA-binding CsgD family transcriptional regulator
MIRAATSAPLSPMQLIVAELLGLGLPADDVAGELKISIEGVRHHVKRAAAKIPSDLPAQQRVIAWARGASADVLQGATLKVEVMNRRDRRTSHSGSVVQLTTIP